jgi:hypothetical protein
VALAGIAWAAFLLKTLLMPTRIFGDGDHLYWLTPGPLGVAPVIGVIPILAAVLGYMLWVMTSTFDTQVRYDTQAV